MRKKIYFGFAAISCLLFLQGCAENPQEDIVVNKNEGTLEKAITKENEEETPRKISERYEDDFLIDAEQIEVSVDAEIQSADGALPVVRVKPHTINGEEAKAYADVLFEGQAAYEPEQNTKAEIEEKILELKERLSDQDAMIAEYGTREDAEQAAEQLEKEIAGYEAEYESAPEKAEKKKCEWKFHSYEYYSEFPLPSAGEAGYEGLEKTNQLIAKTDGADGFTRILDITNRDEEDYRLNYLSCYYEKEEDFVSSLPDREITKDEAVEIGDQLVEKLGFSDWKFYDYTVVKHTEQVFSLFYTPAYEGVQTLRGPIINVKSDDLYAANYYYSEIRIGITNGSVTSVELVSPMDVVKIENPDVETLPFEEIYQAFKNQMQAQFTKTTIIDPEIPGIDEMEMEIRITKIRQGLFRIKEKNNQDDFLVVPVWSFYGTAVVDDSTWTEQEFVMINALDGSVIDTNLGY